MCKDHSWTSGSEAIALLAQGDYYDNICETRRNFLRKQCASVIVYVSTKDWCKDAKAWAKNVYDWEIDALTPKDGEVMDSLIDCQYGLDDVDARLIDEANQQDAYWAGLERQACKSTDQHRAIYFYRNRIATLSKEVALHDILQDEVDDIPNTKGLPYDKLLVVRSRILSMFKKIDGLRKDKKLDYLFWYNLSHQLFDCLNMDNQYRTGVRSELKYDGHSVADKVTYYEGKLHEFRMKGHEMCLENQKDMSLENEEFIPGYDYIAHEQEQEITYV